MFYDVVDSIYVIDTKDTEKCASHLDLHKGNDGQDKKFIGNK
jgi:hypothetical protein